MNRHLYRGFSADPQIFCEAQAFWVATLAKLRAEVPGAGEWNQWLSCPEPGQVPAEGVIFSAYSAQENRGFVVQQYEPTADQTFISSRMDLFGEGYLPRPIPFLLILCELSDSAAEAAGRLLKAWLRPRMSSNEMERLIQGWELQ